MPAALIIAQLVAQYGIPFATSIVEKWSKDEPGNPVASEWLELLKAHSLTRTYDEQIRAAAARAGV